MAYVRKKNIHGNTYYYLVEGKRNTYGTLKQKVLLYLGTTNHIKDVFDFYNKKHKN